MKINLLSEQVDIFHWSSYLSCAMCDKQLQTLYYMCCITLIAALLVKRRLATSQVVFCNLEWTSLKPNSKQKLPACLARRCVCHMNNPAVLWKQFVCRSELGSFKRGSLGLVERKQLLAVVIFFFFFVVLLECVITTNCTPKYARENPTVCISGIYFCIFNTLDTNVST